MNDAQLPPRWATLAPAAVFGAVLLALLLWPVPEGGRVRNYAMDLAHGPAFAMLTWLVLRRRGASWIRPLLLAGAVFAAGAVAEGLQALVGRQASWRDVGANGCGVVAGWLVAGPLAQTTRLRLVCWAAALAVLVVGAREALQELGDVVWQRWQAPLLGSFESRWEMRRWQTRDAVMQRSPQRATHGRMSLRVQLQTGQYPGVLLLWPLPDWSGFDELTFDVYLEEGPPLDLVLKINDELHNLEHYDRYHQRLHLTPGWNAIRTPLQEVKLAPRGRLMDMTRISALQIFAINLPAPRVIYLDHLQLRKVRETARVGRAGRRRPAAQPLPLEFSM